MSNAIGELASDGCIKPDRKGFVLLLNKIQDEEEEPAKPSASNSTKPPTSTPNKKTAASRYVANPGVLNLIYYIVFNRLNVRGRDQIHRSFRLALDLSIHIPNTSTRTNFERERYV